MTLIPWRAGAKDRERNWEIARPYVEAFGYPIFFGDRSGPWSRSAACNAASVAAGHWDVAVITDADTIAEPQVVEMAIAHVVKTGGAARPHDHLWQLTPRGVLQVARKGPQAVRTLDRAHCTGIHRGGGLLVLTRRAWNAVGGYPEEFVGWGGEDSAFNIKLLVTADWDRLPGQAWHLWHERDPVRNTPQHNRNVKLLEVLRRKHARAIAAAEARKGWAVGEYL